MSQKWTRGTSAGNLQFGESKPLLPAGLPVNQQDDGDDDDDGGAPKQDLLHLDPEHVPHVVSYLPAHVKSKSQEPSTVGKIPQVVGGSCHWTILHLFAISIPPSTRSN